MSTMVPPRESRESYREFLDNCLGLRIERRFMESTVRWAMMRYLDRTYSTYRKYYANSVGCMSEHGTLELLQWCADWAQEFMYVCPVEFPGISDASCLTDSEIWDIAFKVAYNHLTGLDLEVTSHETSTENG